MIWPDRGRVRLLLCLVTAAWLIVPSHAQKSSADKKLRKSYALIFGTVWDRENHPVYGAVVKIRREGDNDPRWELISDRRGEFAQRIPPGTADYVVWVADTRNVENSQVARRKLKAGEAETKVHIENDERADISLRLAE